MVSPPQMPVSLKYMETDWILQAEFTNLPTLPTM